MSIRWTEQIETSQHKIIFASRKVRRVENCYIVKKYTMISKKKWQ